MAQIQLLLIVKHLNLQKLSNLYIKVLLQMLCLLKIEKDY